MSTTSATRSPNDHDEGETRVRLLAEAERIFAVSGYEGASVRQITEAAGANVAAVSYYFGGKEGLYRAVFEGFCDEMRERRMTRVEADLGAEGDNVSLEAFLESFAAAFLEPLVDDERGRHFMALFDQEMRLGLMPQAVFFERVVEPMLDLFIGFLDRAGVEIHRKAAALCLISVVGQLIHALKAGGRFADSSEQTPFPVATKEIIPHIVRFSAAGVRACAAGSTRQEEQDR